MALLQCTIAMVSVCRSFREDKGDLEIILLFYPQVFLQGYVLHSGSSRSMNHLRFEN